MYLLGLSSLVPPNKFLKRLAKINPRWDCHRDDPIVQQYLDQESDAEDISANNQIQNETHAIEDETTNPVSNNNDTRSRGDSSSFN